jgi:hypothetical protein
MHAKPTDCPCSDIAEKLERAEQLARLGLFVLLSGEHSPYTRAELALEVSSPRREPADVTDAIAALYTAGLINVCGEQVTPSRAACRMDELLEHPL